MNYSVALSQLAHQQLAAVWLASANRNAVTTGSHAIELTLAAAPHTVGTHLFDNVYEYTHPPLGVEYEVVDADCRVFILAVWDAAHGRPTPQGN